MVIGISVGQFLSEPIGNQLLRNEIELAKLKLETVEANLGNGSGSSAGIGTRNIGAFTSNESIEYIDALNTKLDNVVIIQMMLIGLSIVLIGSIVSIVTISRYEPLKILSTRS
jgi:putative ABC transport system permease protein